eukprot:COSAG02_NODE_9879_length_2084_cov_183.290176_2_plen_200_part_00
MEVSAFMTDQLKAQVVEQRAHETEQHGEMIRLLVEREAKLEAQREGYETKLEAQRKDSESKLEAQREGYETKLEAQREGFETKLEAQRKDSETKLEEQRKDLEAKFRSKLEKHRCETQAQARTGEVTELQRRLEVLSESKLLEDEELSAIFDQVADAIGAGATEDGADHAWVCVMQMVRLSEGIASEKMFAAQLRRKFL